jgi:hypothetical protein
VQPIVNADLPVSRDHLPVLRFLGITDGAIHIVKCFLSSLTGKPFAMQGAILFYSEK